MSPLRGCRSRSWHRNDALTFPRESWRTLGSRCKRTRAMNESHDCQALLAQVGWVRALAQHLTRDGHAADDLAQDAIQAALVRPPPDDRPLQSWLAGIVRNL